MTSNSQVIVYSPDVDFTEKKSALNNSIQEVVTVSDLKGYKVYTALLTQSGPTGIVMYVNSDLSSWNPGDIVSSDNGASGTIDTISEIGVSYYSITLLVGATGSWETSVSIGEGISPLAFYNIDSFIPGTTGAPVATVLENTIGNIIWTRSDVGDYRGTLSNLFDNPDKTSILLDNSENASFAINIRGIDNPNTIYIQTKDVTANFLDGALYRAFIEIRVYN